MGGRFSRDQGMMMESSRVIQPSSSSDAEQAALPSSMRNQEVPPESSVTASSPPTSLAAASSSSSTSPEPSTSLKRQRSNGEEEEDNMLEDGEMEVSFQYHILEIDAHGHRTMSTHRMRHFCCPLCTADYVDLEETWVHCVGTHREGYEFQPLQTEDGTFHLLVKNKVFDGVEADEPPNASERAVEMTVNFDDVFRGNVALPRRSYYRDATFDEIGLAEWLFDEKEEIEDQQWRGIVEDSALYDLTDVTPKEKHFFILWNEFMRRNPILSEIQLPKHVRTFVHEHAAIIWEHKLVEHLTAHLTNMWYEGVIGRQSLVDCMQLYNELEIQQQTSGSV